MPTDLDAMFNGHPLLDSSGEQRPRTKEEEDLIDQKLKQDRRNITIRLEFSWDFDGIQVEQNFPLQIG